VTVESIIFVVVALSCLTVHRLPIFWIPSSPFTRLFSPTTVSRASWVLSVALIVTITVSHYSLTYTAGGVAPGAPLVFFLD